MGVYGFLLSFSNFGIQRVCNSGDLEFESLALCGFGACGFGT